ncbi:uncharacterized protein B0I36DRAFT_153864 [Microdochium trichocladiopsis]|uniref:dual-specificity kinase n=1 Tax=Microdochium trichocladiopsis TaxID=1682393 RepID=A0A9P8Y2R9_9PEZI|nr:uncharacterized protein B0I36DRAFT_153864 [Microdochium trichocladiopsis]KAH7026108.1 hypothetical protein B0I36DRAFT_153864 [Microdochium trichocladiopsis]
MVREVQIPAGPRPATQSRPSVRSTNEQTANRISAAPSDNNDPMLHASSSNNHSLFSFGRNGAPAQSSNQPSSFDFLPSVSFDDLQSSLESASTEFRLTQFPSPTGHGSIIPDDRPSGSTMASQHPSATHTGGSSNTTRIAIHQKPPADQPTRPGRSGSILRRPSTSSRQVSVGSNISTSSSFGNMDPPIMPASSMRSRRQSHYPPVSSSNIVKPPRKSIGPGVLETEYRMAQKRRPSLISNASDAPMDNPRISLDSYTSSHGSDHSRTLSSSSRTAKARSVQPPARLSTANFAEPTATSINKSLTPTGNRTSTAFPRSPRNNTKVSTPGSGRRASVMPNAHGTHATGLGARTISPTEVKRMKRISTHPGQSIPQVASIPPQQVAELRGTSRSPSLIPRKSSTPSSSRTTPDVSNRKSYSSGLSMGSAASINTQRTSTGSVNRGIPASGSASRLPAPKTLVSHSQPSGETDEDVPPVPAIPKAYESPKASPGEASFGTDVRKSGFPFDTSSVHSSSTRTTPNPSVVESTSSLQPSAAATARKPSIQGRAAQKSTLAASSDQDDKPSTPQARKSLQPLALPPLTLGPLSTPTAAKIAALHEQPDGKAGWPRSPTLRAVAKTPTTPMTASKSTFFSSRRMDFDLKVESEEQRSSSMLGGNHLDSPSGPSGEDTTSYYDSLDDKDSIRKVTVSPFLSSSAPKSNGELFASHMQRRDFSNAANQTIAIDTTSAGLRPQQKPTGPRDLKPPTKTTDEPAPPVQPSKTPEEPPTPSSMSSLRRKLSLSWKRSASKSSMHVPAGSIDKSANQGIRQESMPPPRIPVSATMHLSTMKSGSPSHASKSSISYLDSRRRKSSTTSLKNALSKNDGTTHVSTETAVSGLRTSSMQRLLRPRGSAASVKQQQQLYSANDMDKDDHVAEEEMRKLALRRKETELAARTLDALRKRATPKERVGPQEAIRIAMLNIYERGEIIDYPDIYFCGTQNASKVQGDLNSSVPNFGYDDDRGDYTIVVGDHLSFRYEVVDVLGKGSFGQVVRCIDHKTGALVAVKIIRNKKRFHQQALVEVDILQKLREWDPKNRHSMVNFTQSFYFRGHLCISTELLDMNLYEFIKANSFRGFSLRLIRRFTKQMLSSLVLLQQKKVIHCDLKPENILIRHPMHTEIKVIDFGSSCFESEKVYTYIQSRFYRSPEVILGMNYGLPIDMWSLGCILAELFTGVPIFPGENEQEQLACIMEVFGPPEKHLIEKSTRKKLFFDSMGKPRLTVSSKGRRRRPSSKTLQQAIKCDDEAFIDFLARCLRWDPDRRLKPDEAIHHEFITGRKSSVPPPRVSARDASPIKRHNTISTPRPLPEPPAAAKSNTILRPRDTSAPISPHKPVSGSTRRTSAVTGTLGGSLTKRTSTGTGAIAPAATGSGLPRVTGRTASGKQDLASASATVAMSRRA